MKFSIKKNDEVKVIAGKDKGKSGKVLSVLREKNKVIVEGLNKVKKHERPQKKGAKGQIVEVSMPIHISNVVKK